MTSVPSDIWATLLPVIVGGSIAIIGGVLAPIVSHNLQRDEEERKAKRERFQEMVDALYAYRRWINDLRNHRIFDGPAARDDSQLPKARTLAAIYFPQFNDALSQLDLASNAYEIWVLQRSRFRLSVTPRT